MSRTEGARARLMPGGARKAEITDTPPEFVGEVTLQLLEAERLVFQDAKKGEVVKPYAKVTIDGDTHETGPAVGSAIHMFKDAVFKFRVRDCKTARIELFHDTEHDVVKIGTTDITMQYAADAGDSWLKVHNGTGDMTGQVKVRWSFVPGAGPDSDAPKEVEGCASFEIVRIKDLVCPANWVSVAPFVVAEYMGAEVATTTAQKRQTCPYYNQRFELPMLTGATTVTFKVYDANTLKDGDAADNRRLFAVAELTIPDLTRSGKPEMVAFKLGFPGEAQSEACDLDAAMKSSALAENGDATHDGELFVKYMYKVDEAALKARTQRKNNGGTVIYDSKRRRSTVNANGTISLDYEPKLDGSVALVPDSTNYCWMQFLDESSSKFAKDLETRVIEGYLEDAIKGAAAAPATRLRSSRSTSIADGAVRNEALMHVNPRAQRSRSTVIAGDPLSFDTVIQKKWIALRIRPIFDMLKLCADRKMEGGSVYIPMEEMQQLRIGLTERSIMRFGVAKASMGVKNELKTLWDILTQHNGSYDDDRKLEGLRYRALCSQYLLRFAPTISQTLSEELCEAEWREEGSSGLDDDGRSMMFDERFSHFMMKIASTWCDTLTEAEVVRFIAMSRSVVEAAEKIVQKQRKSLPSNSFEPQAPKSGPRARKTNSSPAKGRSRKASRTSSIASNASNGGDNDDIPFGDYTYKSVQSVDLGSTVNSLGFSASMDSTVEKKRRTTRKGSVAGGTTPTKKRRPSKASKKSPFEIAEAKVNHAFDMEDMDWKVMASWAQDVFGGFMGPSAQTLLDLGPTEVRSCMLRLYPDLPKKHQKIQSDLCHAVCDFFAAIKPEAKAAEPQESSDSLIAASRQGSAAETGTRKIGTRVDIDCFDRILTYCDVHTLMCMMGLNRYCHGIVGDALERRVAVSYALPEPETVNAQYLATIFTEAQCKELAREVSLGKMRSPSRLVIALSEMAAALVGFDTKGYWAKFREYISRPDCHAVTFAGFDLGSMTYERFAKCRAIKMDNDYGRQEKGGGQLVRDLLGVSWFTMSEQSILKTTGSQNLLALYRWIRTIMAVYSRQSGRVEFFVQEYGWKDRLGSHEYIFWN